MANTQMRLSAHSGVSTFIRLTILVLGLVVLTASAMADVVYDETTHTFNGSGTYSDAVSSDEALTANPESGNTITLSGVISGEASLTKTGAGTLTLSAANTYSGGTTITAGKVTLTSNNVSGLGTGVVTLNGGTLDASAVGSGKTFANSIYVDANGGTITVAGSSYSSFASISGSGDLTTNGFVHFSGTGGYTGHLTVDSGYTRVNPGSFGIFDLSLTKNNIYFNMSGSGTLQIGKLSSTADCEIFTSNSDAYTFEIGAGTSSTDTASYAGRFRGISGKKNLTVKKVGAGMQTLNRTGYAYGGTENSIKEVIVNEGKLIIDAVHDVFSGGNTTGYWGSAPVTINSGGTLEFVQYFTTSPNVKMTINGGTLVLDKTQYQNQLVLNSGTINGAGNLQVGHKGDGSWTVKGGTSTINNKFVIVKTGDVNKTFTINFDKDATLDIKKGMSGLADHTGTNIVFKGTGSGPGNIIIEAQSGDMSGLGNLTFNNMNGSIAAVYSGTGSITKTGAGTVTLSAANTYSGGTTISGGTLAVSKVNGLGTGAVTVNGGTLDASPAGKTKTFANAIVVGANGGTVTVASGDYSSFASISGSGNLTTNGYLHFNGTGGYSGLVTVNSGFTRINPGAFGVFDLTINNSSNFNVFESGTIQIKKLNSTTGSWLFGSSADNTYNFEIGTNTTASDEASYKGFIRGSSASAKNVTITKVGAGKQTFNTAGKCYGIDNVYVNGGTMVIAATGNDYKAETTEGYWGNATITVNSGGTLVYNGNWNTSPNYDLNVNGGTLTINALVYQNKLNLNSATVNGNTSSELRVGYVGTGAWNVTGGTSTIENKIVAVKSGNNTTFTINIADGATLDIKKNIYGLGGYTGTDLVVNGTGNGTGKIKYNPSNSNYASNMGTILFNNVNVELAANKNWIENPFFGASSVTLKDSTMTSKADHALNGGVFILDKSDLIFNGEINTYAHQITLKNGSTIGGTTTNSCFRTGHLWNSQFFTVYESGKPENVMNTISANIAMFDTGKTMTFNIADKAPLTISGSFVPAASGHYNALLKTGAGTLTLTGQNSYGTTTVSEGKLIVSGTGTLGTKDVTVAQNATLEFAPDSVQNVSNAISGTGAVVKSGDGTLTLTKAPGYTGATTVESGTLALSAGGTLYNLSGAGNVNYGANALTLSNSDATTFDGDILGSGAFKKTGTGTLTLSQQPEYTGSTTIEQGTLALADGGTLYNLSGGSVNANDEITASATLDATGKDLTFVNSETTKFVGSIKANNIVKDGEGTLQIYAASSGQIDANHFLVSSGRLDMKEYFKGSLDVESGATLSPGNSVGTLTVDGTAIFDTAATLLLEVGKNDQGEIVVDRLIVNGDATFAPGSIINIGLDPSSGLQGGDEFTGILITSNNAADIYDNVKKALQSYYFTDLDIQLTPDGKNIQLSATLDANAVPEPSTWTLLILGAAGLLYWRKRSSK
ncbi:MAG: autotransporter-associated beta strand repeat-containing protein [Thermoguttaceae bacterium]|nr:autotransporter-associated beta strand repeat-containing protein [Thermoguttaceae bacterium]